MKKVLWIVVLIGVGLAGWAIWANWSDWSEYLPTPSASVSPSPTAKTPAKVTKSPTVPTSNTIGYDAALKKYVGLIVQFDARCQAIPSRITVKNGTSVMFDNRSGDARWFSLNGIGYYLKGYDFTILPMSSSVLPQTVTIDCGSAQNVGQIVIQR